MKQLNTLLMIIIWCLFSSTIQAQTYQVGDVITNNDDGTKGVVFYIHPDGSGGWMVALNDINGTFAWSTQSVNITGLESIAEPATYPWQGWSILSADKDGYTNTQKIRAMGNSSTYPAAYAVDFAHGWYLPSIGQLSRLMAMYAVIKNPLLANGGTAMNTSRFYWSSTYASITDAWYLRNYNSDWGAYLYYDTKSTAYYVRAVRNFTAQSVVHDTTLTYQWNTGATTPAITVSPGVATTYTVTATTDFGCSNTAEQPIWVNAPIPQTIYDTICAGSAYTANGFELTATETQSIGTTTHSRTINNGGCQVTLVLQLFQKPASTPTYLSATICAGESTYLNGFEYSEAGTYTQRLTASNGCDSLIYFTLSQYAPISTTIQDEICEGNSYLQHGFNIPNTVLLGRENYTTIRYTSSVQTGCDSAVTLHLTINPPIAIDIYDTICQGETYTANGFTISAEETQTDGTIIETVNSPSQQTGCDSATTLHLTINPAFATDIYDAVCQGETYTANGFTISAEKTQAAGTVIETVSTPLQNGCDSVVTLHLTVNLSAVIHISDSICQGEAYTENGFNIPTDSTQIPRIIEQTVHTPSPQTGCDSTTNLHLFVTLIPSVAIIPENDSICPEDSITLQALGDVNGIIQNEGTPPPPIAIGDILCTDNTIIKPQTYIGSGKTAKGVVFYVDITGQHGWVVKHTQDSNTYKWSPQGTDIPNIPNINTLDGALSDFNGYANTQNIRAAGDAAMYPAAYSVDFDGGWYLPAIGQLNLLYGNLSDVIQTLTLLQNAGVTVDFFPTNYHYWSSSKYGTLYPWIVINNGSMRSTHCYFPDVYVREIRSF